MKVKYIFNCFKNNRQWKLPGENNANGKVLQETGSRWLQYAAVISVSVLSMGTAVFEMWISPALPYLKSDNFKLKMTSDQISWIVSLYNMGEITGFLLNSLLINRIGRKKTLLTTTPVQILACVLLFNAKNATVLCAARFIGGVGFGAGIIAQNFYVNEIAEKSNRGMLGFMTDFGYLIGTICISVSGAFLSYDSMNLTLLLFPLIFIATFVYMPESPYFYLKHHRDHDAIKCLSKLRGIKDLKLLELETSKIKEAILEEERCTKFALRSLFDNKRYRKAFIIVAILNIAIAFSGAKVISLYFQVILNYTKFTLESQYVVIIMSVIVAILMIPIILLVDYLGRRLMILYSSIACSLSLIVVGFFFFSKDRINSSYLSSLSWIPLIALIILDLGYIALFAISGVLSGELFSIQIKSTALSISFSEGQFLEFVIKFSFEKIISLAGIHGVFWIYSVLCFVLSIICFHITPETKGKTLEEIQLLLD